MFRLTCSFKRLVSTSYNFAKSESRKTRCLRITKIRPTKADGDSLVPATRRAATTLVQLAHELHTQAPGTPPSLFCHLKQFRQIATRYEELARNFFGMVSLTCAYI